MKLPLLILDLDETLVFGVRTPLDRPPHLWVAPYAIYRRPHLDEFVARVRLAYQLAVWTSATASYAAPVVRDIFPPDLPLTFASAAPGAATWKHSRNIG